MGKYDDMSYVQAGHALQSATAMLMNYEPIAQPKHLRIGLDCRAADAKGLADLLIAKGVFTKEEYIESIRKSMVEELELTAARVRQCMGMGPDQDITFG